jgi:hypothetical protein
MQTVRIALASAIKGVKAVRGYRDRDALVRALGVASGYRASA